MGNRAEGKRDRPTDGRQSEYAAGIFWNLLYAGNPNYILMLEENRQTPESIERSMSLLKNAGVFDKIGGLIIGKCADYKPSGTGLRSWEVMMEMLEEYDFPILAEFDSCHTRPMLTMPIGAEISLNTDAQTVMLAGM